MVLLLTGSLVSIPISFSIGLLFWFFKMIVIDNVEVCKDVIFLGIV